MAGTPSQASGWQPQPGGTWAGIGMGLPASGPNSLADPGQRLLARLVDFVVVFAGFFALLFALTQLASGVGTLGSRLGPSLAGGFGILVLILWLAAFAYEPVLTATRGQTLGKMVLGIKVVNSATGQKPSWGSAFVRLLIQVILILVPFFGLLDVLWLLWDSNRQCLHDKAANTVVVRIR